MHKRKAIYQITSEMVQHNGCSNRNIERGSPTTVLWYVDEEVADLTLSL